MMTKKFCLKNMPAFQFKSKKADAAEINEANLEYDEDAMAEELEVLKHLADAD